MNSIEYGKASMDYSAAIELAQESYRAKESALTIYFLGEAKKAEQRKAEATLMFPARTQPKP